MTEDGWCCHTYMRVMLLKYRAILTKNIIHIMANKSCWRVVVLYTPDFPKREYCFETVIALHKLQCISRNADSLISSCVCSRVQSIAHCYGIACGNVDCILNQIGAVRICTSRLICSCRSDLCALRQ